MQSLFREIQAAHFLGYQEMSDFRSAVKNGEVPAPCRQIKSGRRVIDVWSRRALQEWAENLGSEPRRATVSSSIDLLAG